ncbi:hypothetical protein LCGC14_1945840 [marine sediment metagenome]|uniref:Uncharacterized protein n=1 Tax=marine sediment metagenome TaxID=412755 RepID=A0A0F9FIX3_9ZZZZ
MEPRIQYAQTKDGVSIAFWPPASPARIGCSRWCGSYGAAARLDEPLE